jgi:uroporphyrinogen decarboxylase
MMRQAGRHLPEYLKVRATAENFVDFCFSPDKAAEVTLQPIRRYDMDAAILFADILLIPIGLGRDVWFVKGKGPQLNPITPADISKLTIEGAADRISSVYETVSRVRAGLHTSKALIGFCGGPWTVATYMIEGEGSPKKEMAKRFAYEHPEAMSDLLEALAISSVRAAGITKPIIGFPRGAGLNALRYAKATGITAIAAGTDTPMDKFRKRLPDNMPYQGNLDPLALRIGGDILRRAVQTVLNTASGPHIFNLGHGVTPDVKIENVQAVVNHIRTGDGDYV